MSIVSGKVIVVIGASSGIGEAISKYFAQNGAKTCICARREERLKKTYEELKRDGYDIMYKACDATDYGAIKSFSEEILQKHGKIDVWINCAGQNNAIGKMWELKPEDVWYEINVDLKSAVIGTHVAINAMKEKNSGVIINFCGGGTDKPHLYAAAYSTAKAGIARLTEAVYLELKEEQSNIKIFCTNPGLVHNERTQLLCDTETGKKYMPTISTAFANGKGQSPLNSAYLVEYALENKLDAYNGRLVFSYDLEGFYEKSQQRRESGFGLLRLVCD